MNKYFWTWLLSGVCWAMGIGILAVTNAIQMLSIGYICSEVFQIIALLMMFFACNLLENIPQNYFIVKYGILMLVFFIVYASFYTLNQNVYIVMLLFKGIIVIMVLYTIIVKWHSSIGYKIMAIAVLAISGTFLSVYDFCIYGNPNNPQIVIFLCIGAFLLALQNLNFAVLYKMQLKVQKKLRGDYLGNFAENSADIIFYYNLVPYPRFSFVSPAAQKLLGYTPQNFYSNNKLHVEITLEEDRERMDELLGDFAGDSRDCIVTVETKSGDRLKLECMVTKEKSNGRTVAVEGVFRDVTERMVAEQKIAENNKNRILMLSYISHDLKTPITYIKSYVEAMQKGIIKSDEDKRKAFDLVLERVDSLTKLVDDISMLSKLESGKFNYEFEMISCMQLIKALKFKYAYEFSPESNDYAMFDRNCTFAGGGSNIRKEDCVIADVKRIGQVFENIFTNALKATDNGGRIDVTYGVDRLKNTFFISISDDGIGIREKDLPHIFENFYRSPETKKRHQGSGLGLSLSHQILKGHNGQLTAKSQVGKGSKFTIILPLFAETEETL